MESTVWSRVRGRDGLVSSPEGKEHSNAGTDGSPDSHRPSCRVESIYTGLYLSVLCLCGCGCVCLSVSVLTVLTVLSVLAHWDRPQFIWRLQVINTSTSMSIRPDLQDSLSEYLYSAHSVLLYPILCIRHVTWLYHVTRELSGILNFTTSFLVRLIIHHHSQLFAFRSFFFHPCV